MRYITVLVFMLCFVVAAMGQTNTTGVSTTGGGINPTEAPTVTATVTLVVELSANSANDFNTTALEEAFATSLNVSSDDVTVTVRPKSTKRASLFELVITLKKQVEAGSSPTALSSDIAADVKTVLENNDSPVSKAITQSGATVTNTTPTATAEVPAAAGTTGSTTGSAPTTRSATTSEMSGSGKIISSLAAVFAVVFVCL